MKKSVIQQKLELFDTYKFPDQAVSRPEFYEKKQQLDWAYNELHTLITQMEAN